MTQYAAFRRVPVPPQAAQHHQTTIFPAPNRGLIDSENLTYMQPGGAIVMDNWIPTMQGARIRGGCVRWCSLPETTPVISAFEYASGNIRKMFAANATKLYDVSSSGIPSVIVSGQLSGNYSATQMANAGGDWLIAVNDGGDFPLRYDGVAWQSLSADEIHGPGGSPIEHGRGLVNVCKYRNRLFFIEQDSMNAWYLGIDSIAGALAMIPLSGAATKGGKLLFCASWSVDAGDGLDDKIVFMTTEGEALIFTGSNPADAANWRQEGRYQIPKPMGMNAHISLGGDLLVATVEGIVPLSAAITKDAEQLELAMITKNIRATWRKESTEKNSLPWTMARWDESGIMFVTWPGGSPGARYCAVVNTGTGAWARLPGYDATCFIKQGPNLFFGTQSGTIMQVDRTGYDDGVPYVCTIVGGWEIFQTPPATVIWHQARAAFSARPGETFQPQLTSTTDYIVTIPQPPPAGIDPGVLDLWDEGKWDVAKWDAPAPPAATVRNTGWVSVGQTGFSHAPIVQVTIAQQAKPQIDLISIGATYERAGANV